MAMYRLAKDPDGPFPISYIGNGGRRKKTVERLQKSRPTG